MSSLATMLLPSIHKEAVGGRSDGPTTHGALAQLLRTMTISANHMATWNQSHSRSMLVTNGTVGTGASSRLGRGFCARGIFRAPSHFHFEYFEVPPAWNQCHLSLRKVQLHENFLQRLFQRVQTHSVPQVLGLCNGVVVGALPLSRSFFASLHEPLFEPIHLDPPSLEHLLRLGLKGLLGVDHVHCQLLTERHDERRILRTAFKAQTRGAILLVAKGFGRNDFSEMIGRNRNQLASLPVANAGTQSSAKLSGKNKGRRPT